MRDQPALMELSDLRVTFRTRRYAVQAVRGMSLAIGRGERLGIAGESGSGKSATALAMAGLLPPEARVDGSIRWQGEELTTLAPRERRRLCGQEIGMIFQNPLNSLNPSMTIGAQITEVLRHRMYHSKASARARAVELLGEVGIPNPQRNFDEYPHRFSGGMRQRVMIAIALSGDPSLIVADEPTTALDVTIQAQIIDLLSDLCGDTGASLVIITHDLGVLAGIADRIVIMYAGRIVEAGPVEHIYHAAEHPYTWALLDSISRLDRPRTQLRPIPGDPPSAVGPPAGCAFHERCTHATGLCGTDDPPLRNFGGGRLCACHYAGELTRAAPTR